MLSKEKIIDFAKEYNVENINVYAYDQGKEMTFTTDKDNKEISEKVMFNACSISKLITAILILKLVSENKIVLDSKFTDYIKDWEFETEYSIPTIRELLSHTSGITDAEGSFDILDIKDSAPTARELMNGETRYARQRIRGNNRPGTVFEYSDAGYIMLQNIIEVIEANSFDIIVRQKIFFDLDMKNSSYPSSYAFFEDHACIKGYSKDNLVLKNEYSIYPYASSAGLWSTSADLGKILLEISNGIKGKSKLGISQETYMNMITPPKCSEYIGLGLFLDYFNDNLELSSFGWGQGYQCVLVCYPEIQKGIVVMTNKDAGVHQLHGVIGKIFEEWQKKI